MKTKYITDNQIHRKNIGLTKIIDKTNRYKKDKKKELKISGYRLNKYIDKIINIKKNDIDNKFFFLEQDFQLIRTKSGKYLKSLDFYDIEHYVKSIEIFTNKELSFNLGFFYLNSKLIKNEKILEAFALLNDFTKENLLRSSEMFIPFIIYKQNPVLICSGIFNSKEYKKHLFSYFEFYIEGKPYLFIESFIKETNLKIETKELNFEKLKQLTINKYENINNIINGKLNKKEIENDENEINLHKKIERYKEIIKKSEIEIKMLKNKINKYEEEIDKVKEKINLKKSNMLISEILKQM